MTSQVLHMCCHVTKQPQCCGLRTLAINRMKLLKVPFYCFLPQAGFTNIFGTFEFYKKLLEKPQQVFVIQPVCKGDSEVVQTAKLDESISLVRSVRGWNIAGYHSILLRHNEVSEICQKEVVAGVISNIRETKSVTSIFVSVKTFHNDHKMIYTQATGIVDVFDRNELVLFIYNLRAESRAAKVQVAIASMPLIQQKVEANPYKYVAIKGCSGESAKDRIMEKFKQKEQNLRKELRDLQRQKDFQRKARNSHQVPTVAVVGYTNAGKTSLVKSLSKSCRAEPRDELFATLDVTSYNAVLPNKLKYVLIDTIGFLSEIPKNLQDAFSAIMQDMLESDLIVHVRDMSHPDCKRQLATVLSFLSSSVVNDVLLHNIVEVRNKMDLTSTSLANVPFDECLQPKRSRPNSSVNRLIPSAICYTSITNGLGIETLRTQIEVQLIKLTNRRVYKVEIPANGPHLHWLQTECSVQEIEATVENRLRVTMIAIDWKVNKFLSMFKHITFLSDDHLK